MYYCVSVRWGQLVYHKYATGDLYSYTLVVVYLQCILWHYLAVLNAL